jgi:hypothetical protein
MADIWDIAKYVEDHPDNFEQRWRLAKKMYSSWEYRLALEHLQVLENEWQPKLNVTRYLAATQYRLGRYDEAVEVIRRGLKIWPNELCLREQLARVLEVSGKRKEAAAAWEEVQNLDPKHPIARSAVKRLNKKKSTSPKEDLHLEDSDSGIDLSAGTLCPNCGAQNSDEFDRCWQCLAPLQGGGSILYPTPGIESHEKPWITADTIVRMGALSTVCLISMGIYFSIKLFSPAAADSTGTVIHTLEGVYQLQMVGTRVVTGIALLLSWPVSLWAIIAFLDRKDIVPPSWPVLLGFFMASASYVLSCVASAYLHYIPFLAAFFSLIVILGAFKLGLLRLFCAWSLHLLLVGLIAASTALGMERIQLGAFYNPVTNVPAVLAYARQERIKSQPGVAQISGRTVPLSQRLMWHSTGSPWLDSRTNEVQFIVTRPSPNELTLKFEVQKEDSSETLIFSDVDGLSWSSRFLSVVPDEVYEIFIHGPDNARVEVTALSLLKLRVLE